MNKDLILNEFRRVSEAMGWDSYHSPKNLASVISVEAAKLLENFQWMSDAESELLDGEERARAAADVADMLIYLFVLSHKLDLDPWTLVKDKLLSNRAKFIESSINRASGLEQHAAPVATGAWRSTPVPNPATPESAPPVPAARPANFNAVSPNAVSPSASANPAAPLARTTSAAAQTAANAEHAESVDDWEAVARRIAASREELKAHSLKLKDLKLKEQARSRHKS